MVLYLFVQCACKGVLTGTGRQTMSAILIFVSYYVIALPIGIPLMFFTNLGLAGKKRAKLCFSFFFCSKTNDKHADQCTAPCGEARCNT